MKDELGIAVTPERIEELEQHFMFRSDSAARDVGLILRAQQAALAQVAAERDAARREVERLTQALELISRGVWTAPNSIETIVFAARRALASERPT